MGWEIGFDERWQRDIGYGVVAFCDYPKCNEVIDRGLDYVCADGEPRGGDNGCGLYFCPKHHNHVRGKKYSMCTRCVNYRDPFQPKPDHPEWIAWKMTDPSWAEWRKENKVGEFSEEASCQKK